jgi:hypothetical protein
MSALMKLPSDIRREKKQRTFAIELLRGKWEYVPNFSRQENKYFYDFHYENC